jgi:hypothetical protein
VAIAKALEIAQAIPAGYAAALHRDRSVGHAGKRHQNRITGQFAIPRMGAGSKAISCSNHGTKHNRLQLACAGEEFLSKLWHYPGPGASRFHLFFSVALSLIREE